MTRDDHLLVLLIEECAEIQHRASKALRFGLSEMQRNQERTNAERLGEEIDDLTAVLQLVRGANLVPPASSERIGKKLVKIENYAAYSKILGRVEA